MAERLGLDWGWRQVNITCQPSVWHDKREVEDAMNARRRYHLLAREDDVEVLLQDVLGARHPNSRSSRNSTHIGRFR